jgi:hypothetical protein
MGNEKQDQRTADDVIADATRSTPQEDAARRRAADQDQHQSGH